MCWSSARGTPASRPRWRRPAWARRTAILTQNLDTIGQMSCNPAVGGLAKGHMIREIDALGGAMGLNADATAIQCRMLNASKGPSVRGPRSQCDKKAYQFRLKAVCEAQAGLDLQQGNVARLLVDGEQRVGGVETSLGVRLLARTVVITTGTFMRGLLHVGMQNQSGGRMGDAVSTLSDGLRELGFEVARFKTGTPCRLNGRSIDFSRCEPHPGDDPAPTFSVLAATSHGRDRATCSHSTNGATACSTWNKSPAGPRAPTSVRTPSSATISTSRRCTPGASKASARATARPSRTRSSNSPTRPGTSFSWNPRAATPANFTSTASRRACPSRCSSRSSTRSPGWSRPKSSGPVTRSSTIIAHRPNCARRWKPSASRACSSPGRSTAPAATRKPRRRGSSPGSTPRKRSRAARRLCRAARRPTSACSSTTS